MLCIEYLIGGLLLADDVVDADNAVGSGGARVVHDGAVALHPDPASVLCEEAVVLRARLTLVKDWKKPQTKYLCYPDDKKKLVFVYSVPFLSRKSFLSTLNLVRLFIYLALWAWKPSIIDFSIFIRRIWTYVWRAFPWDWSYLLCVHIDTGSSRSGPEARTLSADSLAGPKRSTSGLNSLWKGKRNY